MVHFSPWASRFEPRPQSILLCIQQTPWACGRGQWAVQSAASGVGTRRPLLASSVGFSSLMSALASVPENENFISEDIWGKCARFLFTAMISVLEVKRLCVCVCVCPCVTTSVLTNTWFLTNLLVESIKPSTPGRGKNHMTSFLLPSNRQAIRTPVCKCGARATGLPFLPNILFWKDHFKEQSRGNVDNESSLSGVFEFPLMSPWLVLWHYWESQVDVTWIQSSWLMLGRYIHCRDLKPVRKIENEKLTWEEIWVMFTFFFFVLVITKQQ